MGAMEKLRDYINELHIRIDYEDYLNLIDMVDELDTKFNCQEDLQDWLTRNWGEIEESVQKSIDTILCSNQGEFDVNNEVDRCLLRDFISDNLKMGLFNVIDTYEVK